jgi:hypothetical protein
MRLRVFNVPPAQCPLCGQMHDKAAEMFGESIGPKAGDCTVCWGCAAVLVFTSTLQLRIPAPGEVERLSISAKIALVNARMAILSGGRPR